MADFAASSQLERWIFSPHDLVERRQAAWQRSIEALNKYGTTRVEVQSDGSLLYPVALPVEGDGDPLPFSHSAPSSVRPPSDTPSSSSLPEPLSLEEEACLRRYYEYKIQAVCAAFAFPNKIQATAILYFKRFYLSWSVMEHDPKHIMLTCIYLSCKVEEFHVSADEFGKGIKQDPGVVLKNELTVLQGLGFDLIVYAPYRSVEGFLIELDMYSRDQPECLSLEELDKLKQSTWRAIHGMMLTDVSLLYPPGQLALAALQGPVSQYKNIDFVGFLERIVGRRRNGHSTEQLVEALREIQHLMSVEIQPDVEQVKRIDRKLKFCRNPGLGQEGKNADKSARKQQRRAKRGSGDAPIVPAPVDVSPAPESIVMNEAKKRRSDIMSS